MTLLNSSFPKFKRADLKSSAKDVASAIKQYGVCYITGFEQFHSDLKDEFDALGVPTNGTIKTLQPSISKSSAPISHSVLYSSEFAHTKKRILGPLVNSKIEIFLQHTTQTNLPASNILHFDKRPTYKVWYYINDIGPSQGPMRVVPSHLFPEYSPINLRKSIGTKQLFGQHSSVHHADLNFRENLETASQLVTGPAGTLFIHFTDSWHGSTPVMPSCSRIIMRAHSRSLLNKFQR